MNTQKRRNSIVVACIALCAASAALADRESDKRFALADANGDGRISREEHAATASKLFGECDANHDGIVTAAEVDAASFVPIQRPSDADKTSTEKIRDLDRTNDGKLPTAEHTTSAEEEFAQIDVDNDGFLSREECAAAMQLMKWGS